MSWTLRLSCDCGRTVTVDESLAGVALKCPCSRKLEVPAFKKPASSLPASAGVRLADDESLAKHLLLVLGVYVLGTVFLGGALVVLSSAPLWVTGYTLAVTGQMWLVFLIIKECHPEAIVWSLLIPGFTWCFAYQRWDIAKWAFACNVGGLILYFAAVFGS